MSAVPVRQDTHEGKVCTFVVDGLLFGVSVYKVQEVLRHREMSPVPRAPQAVSGLINLRGQIVAAVDLRARLGLPPRPEGDLPANVVVHSRGEVVSLLVDDIGDVLDPAGLPVEVPPANLPACVRDVVSGVVLLSDSVLLLLDPDAAADVPAPTRTPGGTP
jgi:purine-binding chemotaxis protein CheW